MRGSLGSHAEEGASRFGFETLVFQDLYRHSGQRGTRRSEKPLWKKMTRGRGREGLGRIEKNIGTGNLGLMPLDQERKVSFPEEGKTNMYTGKKEKRTRPHS